MTPTPEAVSRLADQLRETVARIIDPAAWEFADRWTSNPIMKAEVTHETRTSLIRADAVLLAARSADQDRIRELEGALALVRMSRGWQYLADESRQVIDAALHPHTKTED